jgi:hypothetical protein
MVKSITTPRKLPRDPGAPCSLSGLTSTFRHKCRRAQRHDSSGAAPRTSETIVIITLSMIPHIDLLWHMCCSAL